MGIKTKNFDFMKGRTFEFQNRIYRFRRFCLEPCCEAPICRNIYELYDKTTNAKKFNSIMKMLQGDECSIEVSVKRKG